MNVCRSTLRPLAEDGFCKSAREELADGKMIPTHLDFCRGELPASEHTKENRHLFSVSGMQEKIGLTLDRGKFSICNQGGAYILKPLPIAFSDRPFYKDLPANEHLTMQIASQIFKIKTAANACISFADGELAYLTRRFDYRNGQKIHQEDFCQLSNRTEKTHGENYKYDGSYEEIGRLIKKYCPAYQIEIMRFFRLVIFCYLFSNGDAHMKNFSVFTSSDGDPILTPAYDLLDTSMLFPDGDSLAIDLFEDSDFYTNAYQKLGFYSREDFVELGEGIGIAPKTSNIMIDYFLSVENRVEAMTRHSFLSVPAQEVYLAHFADRRKALAERV